LGCAVGADGASVNRTDLESLDVFWACVKSAAKDGSLGRVRVEEAPAVGVPWNWEERSAYCSFMRARWSAALKHLLGKRTN
jgi:hypothetical protein